MEAALAIPQEQEAAALAERETASVETRALSIQVADAAGYEAATGVLVELKRAEKAVEAQRTDLTGPINLALRRINDKFRPFAERLKRAHAALEGKMRGWRAEQERKAEEDRRWAEEQRRKAEAEEAEKRAVAERATREQEEARRRAEQAKRDEEDAARRAAEAKTKAAREAAEAQRIQAEAARKAADMMAKRKAAEAQAAAEAQQKAERDGLAAQAAANVAALDKPVSTVSAMGGRVTARQRWTFEITDSAKVPREWCIPDEKRIGREVRAPNGVREIPGVRIFEVEDLATGTN